MIRRLSIKQSAFTLIEACIVLALISLMSWLSLQQIQVYRARQAERLFLERFEASWHATREYIAVEPHSVRVFWDQPNRTLIYHSADPGYTNMVVPIPPTLTCVNPDVWQWIRFDHDLGAKPRTLTFKSSIDGQRYHYRTQMMWGMLHVEK